MYKIHVQMYLVACFMDEICLSL